MKNDVIRLRVALSDVFEWAVIHTRSELSPEAWAEVRQGFAGIKQILEEHLAAQSLRRRYKLGEVLAVLESGE
ncbi:MAG: hypothetical protein ACH34X_18400 [Thiolinea sp.]|uniref:Uncharacterized protein n=1 Tax=Thiothrix eikelboomii TaxID=92487 RepID=A0A1T4XFR0_9GAMM|nr:hypothetical protein [Thiothrix eikelboomii]SKA88412.1 hypothetical protein SAMN02745130_02930 [Thiothrix eikelboomii]